LSKTVDRFRDRAIEWAGLLFFRSEDALEILEQARKEGEVILGIDGFFVEGPYTRPSLDDTIDFTISHYTGTDRYADAVEFIKRRDNLDIYYEFVFAER
jgi:hypothetical protein